MLDYTERGLRIVLPDERVSVREVPWGGRGYKDTYLILHDIDNTVEEAVRLAGEVGDHLVNVTVHNTAIDARCAFRAVVVDAVAGELEDTDTSVQKCYPARVVLLAIGRPRDLAKLQ